VDGLPPAQVLAEFDGLLDRYADMSYPELKALLYTPRDYVATLPFDPTEARYFEMIAHRLKMTDAEVATFKNNGFVSIDQGRRLNFLAGYQQIYTSDLPVFITSDSILHALHKSYETMLKELEVAYFARTIDEILADCHDVLFDAARASDKAELADNYRDVDLYLSVARTLLAYDAASLLSSGRPKRRGENKRLQLSKLDQQDAVDRMLAYVDSLALQAPPGEGTRIYGGRRYVDYSQFKPRGHYTASRELRRYFRCMMWLGRVDCGWDVLPGRVDQYQQSDPVRELRNAVLLTQLLVQTGGDKRLEKLDRVMQFFVGKSDNLGVFALRELLQQQEVHQLHELLDPHGMLRLQNALTQGSFGQQMIRSQVIAQDAVPSKKRLPKRFQLFGQRFIVDSFVLAKVVHDEIVYHGGRPLRMKPTGLDVAASLGNQEAIPLLADELQRWQYSANLMAAHHFIHQLSEPHWNESLSSAWLDSLRLIDTDMTQTRHAPTAMKTRAWQMKQLQAQLSSWSEQRHDNILYAKQSYGVPGCAYPAGYVEPYPQFYARIEQLARIASSQLDAIEFAGSDDRQREKLTTIKNRQIHFFQEMAVTMATLKTISRKELAAHALSEEEESFLRKTFDDSAWLRIGSGSVPDYDGWYCRLYYERYQDPKKWKALKWEPTVADVHTDPHNNVVLEVGVGDVNLMIIAVDNERDRAVYVGPVYSYYEFWQPVADRLTDQQWQKQIESGSQPARPSWTRAFQAPANCRKREDRVHVHRFRNELLSIHIKPVNGGGKSFGLRINEATFRQLGGYAGLHSLDLSNLAVPDEWLVHLRDLPDLRSLNLSHTKITDEGLQHLSSHKYLQSLNLSSTNVSDVGVVELAKLTYLEVLDLSDTRVSAEAVEELRQTLKHTQITGGS